MLGQFVVEILLLESCGEKVLPFTSKELSTAPVNYLGKGAAMR